MVPPVVAALVSASLGLVLPDEAAGWRAGGPSERYDPETIFDYIDGHGEVYLAYGMRSCTARRYEGPAGEGGILVDLFEMGSAADAYGVFSHGREGEPFDVGDEAAFGAGSLSFRKGAAYVFLTAERATARSRAAVVALARAIAAKLPSGGSRPPLVGFLPSKGLEPGSVVWLRNEQILTAHAPVGPGNPLGVGTDAPAAIGRYRRGDASAWLVVVEHPSESASTAARKRFAAAFLPGGGPARREDGWWAIAPVRGSTRATAAVVRASSRGLLEALLAEAGVPKGAKP